MTETTPSTLAELDVLLDEERQALTGGDLESLTTLLERKSSLIETLKHQDDLEAELVAPLQVKLRRNRALFEQALAGLRSVAERLQALREVQEGSATYDGQGQRTRLDAAARGRLEKRA